jgi:3-hydroxyisobutyrate dehydrogenase-like beta-hydroxyacid dehydrogenase
MTVSTIALIAPGDMGHALGMRLVKDGGLRVVTSLTGRGDRSKALAKKAGMIHVGDDVDLIRQADVFISVVPPGRALTVAKRFAKAIKAAGKPIAYADLNAISPMTAEQVAKAVGAAGARFVDGGIVGGAPVEGAALPRILVSGPDLTDVLSLNEKGLKFVEVGTRAGQASGLKICFASISKGLLGLGALAFTSAKVMGVDQALRKELERGPHLGAFERRFPDLGPVSYRFAEEMDQIAETFGAAGMTPKVFQGMADLYRFIEKTPLGSETLENVVLGSTMDKVVGVLAEAAKKKKSTRKQPAKKPKPRKKSKH